MGVFPSALIRLSEHGLPPEPIRALCNAVSEKRCFIACSPASSAEPYPIFPLWVNRRPVRPTSTRNGSQSFRNHPVEPTGIYGVFCLRRAPAASRLSPSKTSGACTHQPGPLWSRASQVSATRSLRGRGFEPRVFRFHLYRRELQVTIASTLSATAHN